MGEHPISICIGDAEAQRRFVARCEVFLREFSEIQTLFKTALARAAENQSKESLRTSADAEPSEVTQAEKEIAEVVVVKLSRVVLDDFVELVILAGNGMGFGAKKILRGMYERLVTAAFIAKNPTKAQDFLLYSDIDSGKLWNRTVAAIPGIEVSFNPQKIQELDELYKKAKAQFKTEKCEKCRQPKIRQGWTELGLDAMAGTIGEDLQKLYSAYYLVPTFHTHATAFDVNSRFPRRPEGSVYMALSEDETDDVVMRGHVLFLTLIRFLNNYFHLSLDGEERIRFGVFCEIWRDRLTHELSPFDCNLLRTT